MKKILSVILTVALALSTCALYSCDKENGEATTDENAYVLVSVVDNVNNTTILEDAAVAYTEGMTVLGATIKACADAGIVYEITEDGTALMSVDGLVDFYYSDDAENNNQWIFAVNGKNSFETDEEYSAGNVVASGDEIVWTYCVAEITE